MSTIYFAKFNINEKIYEVYNEKEDLQSLLLSIFTDMNTDVELQDTSKKDLPTNYKFISLFKNPDSMIINGRIVAYAPGTHVSYDEDKDDVVETFDNKKATYVTFSFDINREIVGFVSKNDFGYKQFIYRFKELIEACCPKIGEVQLILETDREQLDNKLSKFKHVKEMSFYLVPPNSDKDLFNKLFDLDSDKLNETGGTKFFMKIAGTAKKGINLGATYIKNYILGISIGYGALKADGINSSNDKYTVNSDKDALYTRTISDHNKDNILEIEEKTKAGIVHLASIKSVLIEEHDKQTQLLKEDILRKLEQNGTGDEKYK